MSWHGASQAPGDGSEGEEDEKMAISPIVNGPVLGGLSTVES